MKTTIGLSLDWFSFTFKPNRDSENITHYFWERMGKKERQAFNNDYIKYQVYYLEQEKELYPDDLSLFYAYFPEFEAILEDFLVLKSYSHYENVIGFLGVSDTCRISYNSPDYTQSTEMGVNVCIPSHGLEWFFQLMGYDPHEEGSVRALFCELKARGCHCSRIDLAFDDFGKTFRPKDYIIWWYENKLRTQFKKMSTSGSSSLRSEGHTFYLGSRITGKMLRIYDKDVESKGAIDAVRYEFELHVKYSRDMFEYLCEHDTLDFIGYLRSFFEVIDTESCRSNRSLCKLDSSWEQWLVNIATDIDTENSSGKQAFCE